MPDNALRAPVFPDPLRIALVGIGGSGKSTVMRLLAKGRDRVALSCMRPHLNPDGPLHLLSRHLDTLSHEADRLGSPDLKLAVLYLQMCTHPVIERFFISEWGARVVISERHPVIDSLAYLPLYRNAMDHLAGPDRAERIRDQLATLNPAGLHAALTWCERLGRRLGGVPDLGTVAAELVALLDLPAAERVATLTELLGARLPDVTIWLDVDVPEALRRIEQRDQPAEPRRVRGDDLARVKKGYDFALASLEAVPVHRLAADRAAPAELAAEINRIITE